MSKKKCARTQCVEIVQRRIKTAIKAQGIKQKGSLNSNKKIVQGLTELKTCSNGMLRLVKGLVWQQGN